MKLFKSLLLSYYRKAKPMKYARKIGLRFGEKCKFESGISYGSEPYLISIGNHVEITSNVSFITHDGATWVLRGGGYPEYENVIKYGKIIIEDNCFIGQNATILPGVTIGKNSIVGTGAVVTKDVQPGTVVGGVPAKYLMSFEEYAKKVLEDCPQYDIDNYRANKKNELLGLFMKE